MTRNLEVMKESVHLGLNDQLSRSGLTGGDAAKLDRYIRFSLLTILSQPPPKMLLLSTNTMQKWAWSVLLPTAGSVGCLPAVLLQPSRKLHLDEHKQLEFLLAAGAGLVIANNASISGAEGGCQAEVGSAAAMSAAA